MIKGLQEIIKNSETIEAFQKGDRVRKLYLRDREIATIRFLTEKDDIILAYMHKIVTETASGGKSIRWHYCLKGDGQPCPHCVGGDKPKGTIYMWAWVYNILHTGQNPALDSDPSAARWQAVKVGVQTYYKEELNMPMVFSMGVGKGGSFKHKIIGFYQEYGSLTDRDYRFSRSGQMLDTTYELIPKEATKKPKEIKEYDMSELPSLEDYITGRQFTFNSNESEESVAIEDVSVEEGDPF